MYSSCTRQTQLMVLDAKFRADSAHNASFNTVKKFNSHFQLKRFCTERGGPTMVFSRQV